MPKAKAKDMGWACRLDSDKTVRATDEASARARMKCVAECGEKCIGPIHERPVRVPSGPLDRAQAALRRLGTKPSRELRKAQARTAIEKLEADILAARKMGWGWGTIAKAIRDAGCPMSDTRLRKRFGEEDAG
ncbi:MAG: hypothetical protein IJR14_06935 [Synergistaceae bacterium]|nr:hypothetical protein [Synergistaceae bacterium]